MTKFKNLDAQKMTLWQELFWDSLHYRREMKKKLEPEGKFSPEYNRIFVACEKFEAGCLEGMIFAFLGMDPPCAPDLKSGIWWKAALNGNDIKYDPAQPRVPAGNAEGGEWTDGGARGGGFDNRSPSSGRRTVILPAEKPPTRLQGTRIAEAQKPFSKNTAIQHALDNIEDPQKRPYGDGHCARRVREAIEAGGVKIPPELQRASAKDYGPSLEKVGFEPQADVPQGTGYPPKGYTPEKGDVAVIQETSKSEHGHMAIYAGEEDQGEIWVSDFIQERGLYPGPTYRKEKPAYIIYRYPDNQEED